MNQGNLLINHLVLHYCCWVYLYILKLMKLFGELPTVLLQIKNCQIYKIHYSSLTTGTRSNFLRIRKDKSKYNLPFWRGLYIQRRMLHDLSGLWSCTHRSLLYPCWASTLYECQLGRTGIKVTIWPSFSPFFPWNASLTGPDQ